VGSTAVQKVILQFPRPLLDRADQLAKKHHMKRSNLIRMAVEEKWEREERERLEEGLRKSYRELADQRAADVADFAHGTAELRKEVEV
jgi:metal-responsive CopG/Arc/MetJ family transcriptional regulator